MLSTLAELKTRFLKVSLWITLCKTFEEMACKSLIDGEGALFWANTLKIESNNL